MEGLWRVGLLILPILAQQAPGPIISPGGEAQRVYTLQWQKELLSVQLAFAATLADNTTASKSPRTVSGVNHPDR